jgi:hypothetical protein
MSTQQSGWFSRHAAAIQSIGTILTALIAIAALVGVKWQIDASARIQQEQSARDIYREFLSLSISRPEFSQPNYCAIRSTPQAPAYESYVEYMLYTAEQLIHVAPDWTPVFESYLSDHRVFICQTEDWNGYTEAVSTLIDAYRARACSAKTECPG